MTCSAELQAKGAGREEEYPIHRSGCACRDDRGRRRRGQWRGALAGSDSQPAGGSQKTGQEARACRIAAGLLRGGTLRLRAVLATERAGRALRCGGADAGAGEVGRPHQDGPARCAEAGAQLPERGSDAGLGAGRRARGAARPGACARAAKKDQLRARHRLQKLLLRRGLRSPEGTRAWTVRYLTWVKTLQLEPAALAATLLDYIAEVDHAHERIERLERAIDQAIEAAPEAIRAVIEGLQSLRGMARISAATIVAELGQLSRFGRAKQLMGYAGVVSSEHSSGERIRRGAITKTGNAHLRRILVEAAWAYRHRPYLGGELRRRQKNASEKVKEISWKAQHRLHSRYARLMGRGKTKQQAMTAVARELAGFVWAVGVEVERLRASRP